MEPITSLNEKDDFKSQGNFFNKIANYIDKEVPFSTSVLKSDEEAVNVAQKKTLSPSHDIRYKNALVNHLLSTALPNYVVTKTSDVNLLATALRGFGQNIFAQVSYLPFLLKMIP